jgi:hypothetical protein
MTYDLDAETAILGLLELLVAVCVEHFHEWKSRLYPNSYSYYWLGTLAYWK